jgi:signal recognition particle subunit SRP54
LTFACQTPKKPPLAKALVLEPPTRALMREVTVRQRVAPPGAFAFERNEMFDNLSQKLTEVFDRLRGRGALNEADVDAAMAEVRRTLIDADVALEVTDKFVDAVRAKAVGAEVLKSVTPGQMVVKIVHDELVQMLGSSASVIDLNAPAPVAIMMVGLQGSGKTTTSAKLAKRLKEKSRKKVLLASLDTRRPAAQEQLKILGEQVGVDTLEIIAGQTPEDIARRAVTEARHGGYDIVILDTAGRTTLNDEMMREAMEIRTIAHPYETLLVADSLTGQDAVNTAKAFNEQVGLSGIILTRADGDARGGAALSMRAVTGRPIKLMGTGEKMDALEEFHPERVATRILGMGDIVSLVEKAAETIDRNKAEKMAARLQKGEFTLDDLASQLAQMGKMGGLSGVMNMLPGMGKFKDKINAAQFEDKTIKRQMAVISSMTRAEKEKPHKLLNFSRKKRIAAGSGTSLEEINKVLKMHRAMADMMKAMGKGSRGMLGALGNMFGGGAQMPSAEDIAAMQNQMPNLPGFTPPGGMPKLPGLGGMNLGGLPGLPKKDNKQT